MIRCPLVEIVALMQKREPFVTLICNIQQSRGSKLESSLDPCNAAAADIWLSLGSGCTVFLLSGGWCLLFDHEGARMWN